MVVLAWSIHEFWRAKVCVSFDPRSTYLSTQFHLLWVKLATRKVFISPGSWFCSSYHKSRSWRDVRIPFVDLIGELAGIGYWWWYGYNPTSSLPSESHWSSCVNLYITRWPHEWPQSLPCPGLPAGQFMLNHPDLSCVVWTKAVKVASVSPQRKWLCSWLWAHPSV